MFLAISFNAYSASDNKHNWKLISKEEQIKVFQDLNNKKDIILLKAEGQVNAPIKVVLSVLANAPKKVEWMPNYGGSKTVVKGKDELNRIEYSISKVPWPFKMIKGMRMQVKKLLSKKEFYLSEINLWE